LERPRQTDQGFRPQARAFPPFQLVEIAQMHATGGRQGGLAQAPRLPQPPQPLRQQRHAQARLVPLHGPPPFEESINHFWKMTKKKCAQSLTTLRKFSMI